MGISCNADVGSFSTSGIGGVLAALYVEFATLRDNFSVIFIRLCIVKRCGGVV